MAAASMAAGTAVAAASTVVGAADVARLSASATHPKPHSR